MICGKALSQKNKLSLVVVVVVVVVAAAVVVVPLLPLGYIISDL